MEKLSFESLAISEELHQAIAEMGFEFASPIQAQAIPHLLEGKDLIGQAQTGTGKTAAFGIPALEACDINHYHPQVLVLCPTRELANQVAEEFKKLGKFKKGLHIAAVYGGESIGLQLKALRRGVHIVIGTPGRVIDHIERGSLDVSKIKQIILDEADEMLNMGFIDDIRKVLETMPEERQTVFFSATMPAPILQLTREFQKEPEFVKITQKELTSKNIEQFYFAVRTEHKTELLARLVALHDLRSSVVFCNTKAQVDELAEKMLRYGISAEALHGDLRQNQRNIVMQRFRTGQLAMLIATDVAARGIDVDSVQAVINYDMPMDPEYYVHRIGRTGRAGNKGQSFSFVSSRDQRKLREVERYAKVKIDQAELPRFSDVLQARQERLKSKILQTLDQEPNIVEQQAKLLKDLLLQGISAEEALAALLSLYAQAQGEQSEEHQGELQGYQVFSEGRGGDRYDRNDRNARPQTGRSGYGPRNEKPARTGGFRQQQSGPRGDMVRIFVNIGKSEKIRKTDILGAITGEAGIAGHHIGTIDVLDRCTFVDVSESVARQVLDAMTDCKIKGKRARFERKY